ncbi:MAG: hypothetical protein ACRC9X_09235, partial [Bacteroidales bacterium]
GLDPQSPIYEQGSYISTNVNPQSIRSSSFYSCFVAGDCGSSPQGRVKGERRRCMVSVCNGE